MNHLYVEKTSIWKMLGLLGVVWVVLFIGFVLTMILINQAKSSSSVTENQKVCATISDLREAIGGGAITAGDMGRLG